jgi:uncharacterized membrane protein
MNKASASTVIAAPIEKVFEFTASPVNGPMFIPNLNQNSNISTPQTQVGQTWDWRYNMVGVDLTGSAQVTNVEAPHVWELKSTGGANSTWRFRFDQADGGTKIMLDIDYDPPQGVMNRISAHAIEKINQKTTDDLLQNLKTILEG